MQRIWPISRVQTCLGNEILHHLPFLHAFLGCDTTSHLMGFNKGKSLTKCQESADFRAMAHVFSIPDKERNEIVETGHKLLFSLYSSHDECDLDELRYSVFSKKALSGSSAVEPKSIPPTKAATEQHSLRVYHQTQTWMLLDLDPCKWGWNIISRNNTKILAPVMTTNSIAPDYLMCTIRCSCKSGCRSGRCSCKKNGISCTLACVNCKSICSNKTDTEDDEVDRDELDFMEL